MEREGCQSQEGRMSAHGCRNDFLTGGMCEMVNEEERNVAGCKKNGRRYLSSYKGDSADSQPQTYITLRPLSYAGRSQSGSLTSYVVYELCRCDEQHSVGGVETSFFLAESAQYQDLGGQNVAILNGVQCAETGRSVET